MEVAFRKKWTFWERFRRELIFFGIPMVCLELIGLPFLGRATALVLVLPATVVGLLAYTAVEHMLICALAEADDPQKQGKL